MRNAYVRRPDTKVWKMHPRDDAILHDDCMHAKNLGKISPPSTPQYFAPLPFLCPGPCLLVSHAAVSSGENSHKPHLNKHYTSGGPPPCNMQMTRARLRNWDFRKLPPFIFESQSFRQMPTPPGQKIIPKPFVLEIG